MVWRIVALFFGVCLIASLAVFVPPAWARWHEGTSYESLLRNPSGALLSSGQGVAESDYVAMLKALDPTAMSAGSVSSTVSTPCQQDVWLYTALVIGYLHLHNVPLWEPAVAALYSTETRDQVRTKAGDTWESLAETYLGNSNLWPLLVLLNCERTVKRGLTPDPGVLVWVADAAKLQATEEAGGQ
jgi:hypothetical protein